MQLSAKNPSDIETMFIPLKNIGGLRSAWLVFHSTQMEKYHLRVASKKLLLYLYLKVPSHHFK